MGLSEKEKLFHKILLENKDLVYRICWGFTSRKENIDDLFQEVFINVWKGLSSFREESRLTTWLHKITINTCLLWRREERKRNQLKLDELAEVVTELKLDEDKVSPLILELRKTIQQLNAIDKSLILLLLEGYTYKEIAEITGSTTNNVGVRINRVKAKIKSKLKGNVS